MMQEMAAATISGWAFGMLLGQFVMLLAAWRLWKVLFSRDHWRSRVQAAIRFSALYGIPLPGVKDAATGQEAPDFIKHEIICFYTFQPLWKSMLMLGWTTPADFCKDDPVRTFVATAWAAHLRAHGVDLD